MPVFGLGKNWTNENASFIEKKCYDYLPKKNTMKLYKFVFVLIAFASLSACEPKVTFTEPQPAGVDKLSKFPKLLQGEYLSLNDNSVLIVEDKLIQHINDFESKMHSSEVDSSFKISGDLITDVENNVSYPFRRDGDSLIISVHQIDTLINLNLKDIAKKYKGYYFLNKFYEDAKWEVKKIELSKGELTLSSISSEEDINNLKTITESPQDSVAPYKFTPTKKQFKEFVKSGGFKQGKKFVKKK
jgi:hypothetical protein